MPGTSLPIDEGMPVINPGGLGGNFDPPSPSNATYIVTGFGYVRQIYGSNLVTEAKAFLRNVDPTIPDGDQAFSFYVLPGSDLENNTKMWTEDADTLLKVINGNLHVLNPITYNSANIAAVIGDFLYHQSHIGLGYTRLKPISDVSNTGWIGFPWGDTLIWNNINQPVDNFDPARGVQIVTGAVNQGFRVNLSPLPAYAGLAKEVTVCLQGAIDATGGDHGIGLEVRLYSSTTLLGTRFIDMRGDYTVRFASCKFEGLSAVPVSIEIVNRCYRPGASSVRKFAVCALECMTFYECTTTPAESIQIDDLLYGWANRYEPFGNGKLYLDMVVREKSYREAILDMIEHAPDMMMYLDYKSRLNFSAVNRYEDAPNIYRIAPDAKNIRGIKRRWKYDDKWATRISVAWGVQFSETSFSKDKELGPNDQFMIFELGWPEAVKAHVDKKLDRHYIRDKDSVRSFAELYLGLYSKRIDAVDVICELSASVNEPGDVIVFDFPELGYTDKYFVCVAKEFDDDAETVTLTLFDLQTLPVDIAPSFGFVAPAWGGFDAGAAMGIR